MSTKSNQQQTPAYRALMTAYDGCTCIGGEPNVSGIKYFIGFIKNNPRTYHITLNLTQNQVNKKSKYDAFEKIENVMTNFLEKDFRPSKKQKVEQSEDEDEDEDEDEEKNQDSEITDDDFIC